MLDPSDETPDLLHALSKREILVHIFDEQNRELLGYCAEIDAPLTLQSPPGACCLPELDQKSFHLAYEQAAAWIGLGSAQDDADAIKVHFTESLIPEDLMVLDLRYDQYTFHGSKGFGFTSLEREDAGRYQEMDIINLIHRVFRSDQIYHAPKRFYDMEEIADIVVITDSTCQEISIYLGKSHILSLAVVLESFSIPIPSTAMSFFHCSMTSTSHA